ncbi:META domain-containing protein [Antarctobacter sp.]|uniref:META domain-containing protein n=1 Tax=Antarctobacter sp. TaxID=1872577 RepID=UPI002B27A427|nr:META domain-containing protein [Antarctobacter sp.]
MRATLFALLGLASSAVAQDGMTDVSAKGRWVLQSIGDAPFTASAELDLSEPGRLSGRGPCNGFSGRLDGVWPEISVGPLRATRRACPELAQEHVYFMALQAVRLAELREGTLVLTDAAGREMVFTALPAP